ncbi:hypothetical protein [Lysinibacillus xylanilyticus]|uniref:Uncharacterized protein n=1 Tax=Lysinibacillus xylanilyticus TaxID=582475 RepID=A0A2M9PYT5_9BACI|nr:hypothetical protein [Lysinibacillus xylanilyticus]PJO40995.1 hypothetical protein CWD94_25275 [Lysinibacillus xylanilyticus]
MTKYKVFIGAFTIISLIFIIYFFNLNNLFSHEKILEEKNKILLDKEWAKHTASKILSAKNDGFFYDFYIDNNREPNIDETLRYAEVYLLLNKEIPTSTYVYLKQLNTESSLINSLKKNYLLNNPKVVNSKSIIEIINDTNKNDLEKISNLFFILKYSNFSEDVKIVINEFLRSIDLSILEITEGQFGNIYEYSFLTSKVNFESSLKAEEFFNVLVKELENEGESLTDIFYLQGIVKFLDGDIPNKYIEKISCFLNDYVNDNSLSIVDLYIITTIMDTLEIENNKLYSVLYKMHEKNVKSFSTENGGFTAKRTIKPSITSDLLARVNLSMLDKEYKPPNLEKYLLIGDYQNWRIKMITFMNFEGALKYQNEIKKDIISFNKILKSTNIQKIDNVLIENIYYITEFYKFLNIEFEKEDSRYYTDIICELFKEFKIFNSTEQRYLINSMVNLNYEFDKDLVHQEIINYYNEKQGIFIRDDRNDILLNYDYCYILNILNTRGDLFYNEILLKFINNSGGFNTVMKDNNSTSLISTYYGLLYYYEVNS